MRQLAAALFIAAGLLGLSACNVGTTAAGFTAMDSPAFHIGTGTARHTDDSPAFHIGTGSKTAPGEHVGDSPAFHIGT